MGRWKYLLLATLLAVAPLVGCAETGGDNAQQKQSRLDALKSRGKLNCGVDGGIPGFSFVDESGKLLRFRCGCL